jgi:RNA polymerase sigma-70 factor (ECF subfamily)
MSENAPLPDHARIASLAAERAIPELLNEHGGRLYAMALRMCGNEHAAEDLLQETFLQAYRKWDQFEGRAAPTTWLYTIAARKCRRMHRKRAGEPNRMAELDPNTMFSAQTAANLPTQPDTPVDAALRNEATEHIEAAITRLPRHYRLPLILKEIVGMSVEDVAAILSLKPATIKTRLHRARHALRDELSRNLPQRAVPPPAYNRRVCMDMLRAKQEALDSGVPFPVNRQDFCDRCAAVFAEMDLAKDACESIGDQHLPPELRQAVLDDIAAEAKA